MANTQSLIELNGKLYDASNGKPLDAPSPKPMNHVSQPSVRAIDGVIQTKHISVQHQTSSQKPARRSAGAKAVKRAPKHVQKSKTLMRSAVRKPVSKSNPVTHSQHSISKPGGVPSIRLNRAEKTSRHNMVSRFGAGSRPALSTKVVPLPVQSMPASHPGQRKAVPAAAQQSSARTPGINFEQALHNASSHQQPKSPKPRLARRIGKRLHLSAKAGKALSIIVITLLSGGFLLYNNLPGITMRLAAARAGVEARLPGYHPAGFDLSHAISYSPGTITVEYESTSDERSFALTQQKTELSTQKLLQEQVAVGNQSYQTLENQGKTIFLYKGTNAAWVDNGTLYKIEGNSALSSEQLLRVANSL